MQEVGFQLPAGILSWVGKMLTPPAIEFGSPVQRAKGEAESFWHIPINIHFGRRWSEHPRSWGFLASMNACEVWLERLDGNAPVRIRLCWGDAFFEDSIVPEKTLRRGHSALVPIAYRSEIEGDPNAYWAEIRHFTKKKKVMPISADRAKHYFRLFVKSGKFERTSPLYQLRVPLLSGNGHFTIEKVYDPITDSAAREEAKSSTDTTLDESDLNELRESLLLLSVHINQQRLYAGNRPTWELTFSLYNGSKADVEIFGARGRLGRYSDPLSLADTVVAIRGKITDFKVEQVIEAETAPNIDDGHTDLSFSSLKILARPKSAPINEFELPIPEDVKFVRAHGWAVSGDSMVRFHKDRLDSWGE